MLRKPAGRSQPTLEQTLAARPTRNAAVRAERRGDALVLFVPLRQRWWNAGPVAWLLPMRRERGVALDTLGQEVWQACDGQRDLETMVEDFADRHRLGFHEARLTVMRFLRMLAQRKLLVLVGSIDEASLTHPDSVTAEAHAKAGVA